MENPENSKDLSPEVMYKYMTHRNIPWNNPQYQPLKQYVDPIQQMTDRKYKEQKKGEPDNKYQTKKGFYMDYHLKIMKALPAPSQYILKDPFDQTQNKKRGKSNKINKKLIKYSYLDRIQMEQKNHKTPAPGEYNLTKSQAQLKQELKILKTKKHSVGQKSFFYQDFEARSNSVPGMGTYNPHLEVKHIRPDKKDQRYWIQKSKKLTQSMHKKRLSQPAPGSYSPCPLNVTTFDRIKTANHSNRQKKNIKLTGFGTDAKFPYNRPNKRITKQQRPAPSTYNTMIQWKGKNMETKKDNWIRSVSTGFSQSVYKD